MKTMASFATGFQTVVRFLLMISGGLAAVLLYLAVVILFVGLAGMVFDRVTQAMANRWKQKGRQPKGKLGRIILAHHSRQRE